jgi:hypothetical protein
MACASYRKPFRNPKFQTPNTNEIEITKNQSANGGMQDWDLEFPWRLGIGIWCFHLCGFLPFLFARVLRAQGDENVFERWADFVNFSLANSNAL